MKAILATFNDPAPTAMRLEADPLDTRGIVIAPDTVSVIPELIVSEVAVLFVKVIDVQAALAVTVTLKPFSINTTSPATGTEAPAAPPEVADHVEVEFQLPEATEYRVAP